MANGNLFKSFTDIQVTPAKGAGLAMERTINSLDALCRNIAKLLGPIETSGSSDRNRRNYVVLA